MNKTAHKKALVVFCAALLVVAPAAIKTLVTVHAQQMQASAPESVSQPSAPAQPEIKAAPATPIAEKKAELGDDETWQPEWDVTVEQAIPPVMLSSQVSRAVRPLCPRFSSLSLADKRAFWAYLFQALAGAEAGLRPTANVQHTEPEVAVKDDVTHRMVRAEGLLQLTYMDSERYNCDFDWEKDKLLDEHDPAKTILQPKNNLLCGVNIMKNQIVDQHKPLLSTTSYWSTLQPGTISVKMFLKQMANVPQVCGRVAPHKAEPVHEASNAAMPAQPDAGSH